MSVSLWLFSRSVLCHCSIGILSVRGSVCAAIPGSQRMGDQMSAQIEYSTRISCSWYSFCVKSKVHVFGVPCLAESCIRNPKFSICNQWSECCEEFGNLTCWSIWSVKWYMQQPGWMQDARSRNCGSYILSKKHHSNLGFLRQWFRTETGIQVRVWCHEHYIYTYLYI